MPTAPTPTKPAPVGRPRKYPVGSRPRTWRLTDAEFAKVDAFVKKLRAHPAK